jgi:hypothetical protein
MQSAHVSRTGEAELLGKLACILNMRIVVIVIAVRVPVPFLAIFTALSPFNPFLSESPYSLFPFRCLAEFISRQVNS